jgi:C1A family cysteine protease
MDGSTGAGGFIPGSLVPPTGFGGRHLQNSYKDWRDTKFLGDVKNQGGCGSCWAFAATTVQETMQAIKDDTDPIRLSEQEGVDCDNRSYGCSGGWMHNYWKMSKEIGSQSEVDYEYEA